MAKETEVIEGSANVFADIGLPNADAHQAKASLVLLIYQTIISRGLTQSEVATIAGVPQPQVSNLMNGRSQGFSTDRLMRVLNALGQDVEIHVKPRPRDVGRSAQVLVIAES